VGRDQPEEDLDAKLREAAFVCDLMRVRDLLARGASPDVRDEDQRTPLHQAVLGNSVGLVGLLIESGADVNARDDQGFTPLHFAAQEHAPEIARVLVGKGADVNARDEDGNSVLWRAVAAARGRDEIVRFLLENGARDDLANCEGVTPRELALRLGSRAFTSN
jgi:ankyrin repeat protein